MACKVDRNSEGFITKVLDQNGNESRLFISVASNPFVETTEKALEIYKNIYSPKIDKTAKEVTSRVSSIYNQNQEISNIGTTEQYQEYLSQIFPQSQLKDVVYHGTKRDFEDFDTTQIGTESDRNKTIGDFGQGFYFTDNFFKAEGYSINMDTGRKGAVKNVILNITNPLYRNSKTIIAPKTSEELENEGYDGVIVSYTTNSNMDEIVVPNSDQIHVLGSAKDIQQFQDFVSNPSINESGIQFVHEVNGKQFSSLKSALKEAVDGQKIELGFTSNNEFTSVMSVTKNVDKSSVNGFTQASILEGTMAENRVKIGNEYLLQSEGQSEMKKNVSLDLLANSAMTNLGSLGIEVSGTTVRLNENLGKTAVYTKSGERQIIDAQELDELSIDELKARYENYEEIFAEREYKRNVPLYRETSEEEQPETVKTEDEVKLSLYKLLKNMGVTVTSITNYTEKFQIRNSVPIQAEALADIAQRVIAFQTGAETLENLTEETIHFIVEALPQERLENILRNIDKSEEYKEFAQTYREVYSREYNAEEAEMAVRKEVLGKIALNAVQQSAPVSETTQNFFNSAIQFIQQFFQDIASYFKPQYISDLNGIITDIQDILNTGDISGLQLDNLDNNRKRFYSLDTSTNAKRIAEETKKQIDILSRENDDLSRNQQGSQFNKNRLLAVQKELDDKLEVHAVATVARIADNNVNRLFAAIKDSQDKGKNYDLSQEEVMIFKNLIGETTDTLGVIKKLIEDDTTLNKLTVWQTLSKSIGDSIQNISNLKAQRDVTQQQSIEKQINAVTVDRGLSAREKEAMLRWSISAENDISWIGSTFGTLNNSPDALMSLFATVKTGMISEGSRADHNQIKNWQKVIYDNGFDEKVISTFVKDGYFLSERDIAGYQKQLDENFLQEYKKVFTDTKLKDEEILNKRSKGTLEWSDEQKDSIYETTRKLNENESERRMKDEYYAELEQKFVNLNISKNTQNILQGLNADKRRITERARDANGKIDLTLLSGQDIQQLNTLNLERKQLKSFVDELGNLKEGLKYSQNEEGKTIIEAIGDIDQLPAPSRQALDLNKLDNSYDNTTPEGSSQLPQSFIDLILSKDDRQTQIQALQLNSQIGFSSDFWDSFGNNKGLVDKLEDIGGNEDLIEDIKANSFRLKNIIKVYTKSSNPSETDVENMPELARQTVRDIQENLEELYAEARELTADITSEDIENLVEGVSGVNESWNKRLLDLGLDTTDTAGVELEILTNKIAEEAKANMTAKNRKTTQQMQDSIESYINGFRETLPKSVMRKLEEQNLSKEDLLEPTIKNQFVRSFAESRLLPYYRRYTPQGYVEFQNDLNSDKPVSEILNNLEQGQYQYVEVKPNYSFQDEDTSQMNPNYIVNSGMGSQQPKLSKYKNTEFDSLFGTVTRDNEGNYISATKNEKLFEVYKATIKLRKDQIALMDGDSSYNIYLTPQIRKQGIERYLGGLKSLSGQSIKDAFENITTYTEDDQIQGDNRLGTANKSIPKPFYARLENQTDITEDIFHGLAMTNKAANIYASRVKYFGDAMAIIDKASTRTNADGKIGTATNRFKALDSAMDNDFFGIKQATTATIDVPFVGKIDGGKVVEGLGSFLRFKGLGGSVIIPTTAFLTAKTAQTVERIVGQYINNDSFKRGSALYHDQVGQAIGEINHVRTKSKLNSLGQYWGAFDLENTLSGSKFSAFPRLLSKSSMLLYTAANYPLYGKGMLTVLNDFRVVNGRVVKFTDFQRNQRTANLKITNAEIKQKWSNENNVIYDFQDVSENGEVNFNREKLKAVLKDTNGNEYSDQALEEEIERLSQDIRIQIKNINVKVDLQLSPEDKVQAQRNFLLNFIMMFKGYLVVLFESRFKSQGFNTQSRQLESGSYSGIYRMIGDIVKEWKQNGNNFIEAFKNQYNGNFTEQETRISELEQISNKTAEENQELQDLKEEVVRGIELSELRKYNLKKLGVDLLFVNTIMLISMLLRSLADDDKKRSNWALQMSNLLVYRLVGELHSANTGIASNYWQTAKEPLQAFEQIINLNKLLEENSWKEGKILSTTGKFMPFANSFSQLTDPAQAFDSKRYYQEVKDNTFWSIPMWHLLNKDSN